MITNAEIGIVPEGKRKTIYLLDWDHESLQKIEWMLQGLNDFALLGKFDNCSSLVENFKSKSSDLIIMELEMPIRNELMSIRKICSLSSKTSIIVYTELFDPQFVYSTFEYGARGYILKTDELIEIARLIKGLASREIAISNKVSKILVQKFHRNLESPLSTREIEVIDELAKGKTLAQISKEMEISNNTAKTHVKNIYRKLRISKKADAISIATKNRWI